LINKKISKIGVNQTSDFKAKMHQNRLFGWGSAPDPAGGAYSAPQLYLRGLLLRRKKGKGKRGGKGGDGENDLIHPLSQIPG